MNASLPGINQSALWNAWKEVRKQLKRAPRRDVLDFLEYDIDPDVWMKRTLRRLQAEDYAPERPTRYTVAKSKGFDRIITLPSVPDLVLYRAIVDRLYQAARRRQVKHAYFSQVTLSKAVLAAGAAAVKKLAELQTDESEYASTSRTVFLEWLKYDQYRKLLIFDRVYPFIVVTDITNLFDSILYARIEESLFGLAVPSRMVSLLFLLLESLSLRAALTPAQRIGLPVDPCDCSRVLAHMMLFPHDDRMVKLVGEDAYVRWMDDQNIGVESKADGLRVLQIADDSLRKLHLTPNSSKTNILSLVEARSHFHFTANADLDRLEKLPHVTTLQQKVLRKSLASAWKRATKHEGHGEWQKVLKRFYRQAARARSRLLITRSGKDIKEMPGLAERVTDYVRYVSTVDDVVTFVEELISDQEQIYSDVNYQLIESLLKLSPGPATSPRLRELGMRLLDKSLPFPGADDARALAPLLILRYGDGRSIRALFSRLWKDAENLPQPVTRAICAVVGGCGKKGFTTVEATASRLLRNHLSEFLRLVLRVKTFKVVPGRFKDRLKIGTDSITGASFVDMRSILAARILGLCTHKTVHDWLAISKAGYLASNISSFELKLVERLWPMPDHGK